MTLKRFIIFLIFCVYVLTGISNDKTFAGSKYGFDSQTEIIQERTINDKRTDVFVKKNGKVYLNKMKKGLFGWNAEEIVTVKEQKTGYMPSTNKKKKNPKFNANLNLELQNYGIDKNNLPSRVDLSGLGYLPSVGEQTGNSCVGWAVGYYLRTFQQAKDIGWNTMENGIIQKNHVYSPSFIYNQINNGKDEGSKISDAANLIQSVGVASLEEFPYVANDYKTIPNESVRQSAYSNRVLEWDFIFGKGDNVDTMISSAKQYLNTKELIVVGSAVGYGFLEPYFDELGNSIITYDSYVPFRHAYTLVGYDDTIETRDGKGAFKLVNSFGTSWGASGFSYISYKAFSASVVEAFVFTDFPNSVSNTMKLEVSEQVEFAVDFTSDGKMDYSILDQTGQSIYQQPNLLVSKGSNSILWNGSNQAGLPQQSGDYKLLIKAYTDKSVAKPFVLDFKKTSKIKDISSTYFNYDNQIQYVEIPILLNLSGNISIYINYEGTTTKIVSDVSQNADETILYRIDKAKFDFNNKDLNKIHIGVEVN